MRSHIATISCSHSLSRWWVVLRKPVRPRSQKLRSSPGRSGALEEGLYGHVDPYNKEIVELRAGRFRYWFSSDAKSDSDPHYPLSGRYDFRDGVLSLQHQQIYQPKFRFRIFKGVATLWN